MKNKAMSQFLVLVGKHVNPKKETHRKHKARMMRLVYSYSVILELQQIPHLFLQLVVCHFHTNIPFYFFTTRNQPHHIVLKMSVIYMELVDIL